MSPEDGESVLVVVVLVVEVDAEPAVLRLRVTGLHLAIESETSTKRTVGILRN